MDWTEIKDDWALVKEVIQQRWARLTDDDLRSIDGDRAQLILCLQQRYPITRDMAEHQVRRLERLFQRGPGTALR